MAKAIFNFMIGLVSNFIKLLWAPLDNGIALLFPNVNDKLTTFTDFLNTFINNNIAWFANILPPGVRALCIFWLGFMVSYYTFAIVYDAVVKIFNLIQKIKFW